MKGTAAEDMALCAFGTGRDSIVLSRGLGIPGSGHGHAFAVVQIPGPGRDPIIGQMEGRTHGPCHLCGYGTSIIKSAQEPDSLRGTPGSEKAWSRREDVAGLLRRQCLVHR